MNKLNILFTSAQCLCLAKVPCQHGDDQHSLSNLDEAAGRRSVQGSPALVVPSVDVTPALHQKLHHLSVFVDAGLPEDTWRPHDGSLHKCWLFTVYSKNPCHKHKERETRLHTSISPLSAQQRRRSRPLLVCCESQRHFQNLSDSTDAPGLKQWLLCLLVIMTFC